MPLALRYKDTPYHGMTYYTDNSLGAWISPAAIYVPPGVDLDKGTVDVLIWLHGFYVHSVEALFTTDRANIQKQVAASGRNVVLAAPYFGQGGDGNTYDLSVLKGVWGEIFLNQLLGALGFGHKGNPVGNYPTRSIAETVRATDPSPNLHLANLVIACHSGGGTGMRLLVDSLGRYKHRLAACWGFDCLYDGGDANAWYKWATASDSRYLYVSFGKGTAWESVRLYLLQQGLANADGSRRSPEGEAVNGLEIKLGASSPKDIDTLIGLDDLLQATTPNPKRPPTMGGQFVVKAAENLRKNVVWPADMTELHYAIARDGLLEMLQR